ncbi:MAG TPA: DinB family protein [Tepidisphaeraceae bacterium]
MHSFRYAMDYLREQVADVGDEQMAQQPRGLANHAAWTLGHVIFSCQLLGEVVGVKPWLADEWTTLFGTDSVPSSDAAAYPSRAALLAQLDAAQRRLIAGVEALSAAQIDAPFPDPAYHDVFPTVRHALTQVMVGHVAHHVGQLTAWRKALGLPRLKRGFE